jgi:hypothetical protein
MIPEQDRDRTWYTDAQSVVGLRAAKASPARAWASHMQERRLKAPRPCFALGVHTLVRAEAGCPRRLRHTAA